VQLQQRIDEHRATAAAVVARLAEDPNQPSASAALSVIAARGPRTAGLSPAAAIAQAAADMADEAATVAERMAIPARIATTPRPAADANRSSRDQPKTPAVAVATRSDNARPS